VIIITLILEEEMKRKENLGMNNWEYGKIMGTAVINNIGKLRNEIRVCSN
jgi:hypothetical protein